MWLGRETVSVDTTLMLFIHRFPLKYCFAAFHKLWELLHFPDATFYSSSFTNTLQFQTLLSALVFGNDICPTTTAAVQMKESS